VIEPKGRRPVQGTPPSKAFGVENHLNHLPVDGRKAGLAVGPEGRGRTTPVRSALAAVWAKVHGGAWVATISNGSIRCLPSQRPRHLDLMEMPQRFAMKAELLDRGLLHDVVPFW